MNILNVGTAVNIGIILSAAQTGARVRWLNAHGDIVEGVARHVVKDERANFLNETDDVRDSFLRISGTLEYFIPVRELITMIDRGEFAIDS